VAIIVIPEEADMVIRIIREGEEYTETRSPTYLLTYSAPTTRRMVVFNTLSFYSIPKLPDGWTAPPWLSVEVGIYAGRLYFGWGEYAAVCDFLGLHEESLVFEEDAEANSDLDERTESTLQVDGASENRRAKTFTARPLAFLQEWLAVRRRGQDYTHTPMGFITQGKALHQDLAFFKAHESTPQGELDIPSSAVRPDPEDDQANGETFYAGYMDNVGQDNADMEEAEEAEDVRK
jgi:hypothetical protein